MGFYDITYSQQIKNLLPSNKRKEKIIAFIQALVKPIQWLRDALFSTYLNGFIGDKWDNSTEYIYGQRVIYIDGGVYECVQTCTGITPTNTDYWANVTESWIGLNERVNYNSQKLILEYALNRYFETSFFPPPLSSQIYIVTNLSLIHI